MRLIDMHCDTLYRCYYENCGLRENDGMLDLVSMKENGALAQFFAIFLHNEESEGETLDQVETFNGIYTLYKKQLAANSDLIAPSHSYDDVIANEKAGKMSSVLTVENGALLHGDLRNVQRLYDKGVRLITLLWNDENCNGYPASSDPEAHKKGLKEFGRNVVYEMEKLGMIVDVSHLSEGGFYDVSRITEKPFVASHSCARALCDHQRNLTDDQLRRLADCGGVVGVNFYASFIKNDGDFTTIEDIMRHIEHIYQVAGEDAIGLGSDFDGIDSQIEFRGYSGYQKLADAIAEAYPARIAEKICYGNVLSVMKACL